jgi:hypothetical protein
MSLADHIEEIFYDKGECDIGKSVFGALKEKFMKVNLQN